MAPRTRPGDAGTGTDTPIDVVLLLRALRRDGKTREDARAMLRDYGIEFRNDLWTQAGEGLK